MQQVLDLDLLSSWARRKSGHEHPARYSRLAIGVAVWMRTKFGPEYDKTIEAHKDRSHAATELENREKRVAQSHIRLPRDDERARYAEDWRGFVDEPRKALVQADELVASAIKKLAEVFASERQKLEAEWDKNDNL